MPISFTGGTFPKKRKWERTGINGSLGDNVIQHPILFFIYIYVQFSHLVMSDSLWPHGLKHSRLLGPSPTPGAYSNSCPLSRWCHPNISSSVSPFSSHLQSSPTSGSFIMSWSFASGGQSIGVSASASVLPMRRGKWCKSQNGRASRKQGRNFVWTWRDIFLYQNFFFLSIQSSQIVFKTHL